MTQSTDSTARTGYIDGLRALADILEQNPEVPLPYHGKPGGAEITLHFLHGDNPKAALAATIRAIGGKWDKETRDTYYDATTVLCGLAIRATAFRDAVCERVVTGTREVTRTEQITEVTGSRTVTETVEDVEWICRPLLTDAASA